MQETQTLISMILSCLVSWLRQQRTVLIKNREGVRNYLQNMTYTIATALNSSFCPYKANGLNISENWSTLDADSIG